MSELRKYFQKKNLRVSRGYISKKLDFEIRKTKELLEKRYKAKYGKRKNMTYQASSEAVADRIRELRYNGKW